MSTNPALPQIRDTESLPCPIRVELVGHYSDQRTIFIAGKSRTFKPVFVAREAFKAPLQGYGRGVYKCTANGQDYFFFAPHKGKCTPFRRADLNPDCELV